LGDNQAALQCIARSFWIGVTPRHAEREKRV